MLTLAPYAELHCVSNFTFLRGASRPEELIADAPLHFLVGQDLARARIGKTAVDHSFERQFTEDFFVCRVVGLRPDGIGHLFLGGGHDNLFF